MNSKPIVFLPGTLCDERLWQNQTENFPLSTVVDLRSQNSIQEMVESVENIPYENFVLVGFSLGGYVAQEFSLKNPDRVMHLVLVGSSAQTYPEKEKAAVEMAKPFIAKGLFKGITDKRLREYLSAESYAHSEIKELIKSMSGTDAGEVYLRQTNATINRPDLTEKLSMLKIPKTAIGGQNDKIVEPETIKNLENKGFEVFMLENCGHFIPLEKSNEFNTILSRIIYGE